MSAYDDALKAGGVAVSETPYEAALKQGGVPLEEPGIFTRAGSMATSVWDAARGAVKAINKTAAGEVDVSGIVSPPAAPRPAPQGDPAMAWGMPAPTSFSELKATGATIASFPGDLMASSIAGLTGLTELATGGGLEKAGKTIEKTTEALSPSAAVRPFMSSETKAAQERQMTAVGAIVPPGGVVAQAGEALGLDEKYAPLVEGAINLAAIGGPAAVAMAKPSVLNSNWYRKLTIKERGLVLSTVDQMKASGMSEADIIRIRPEEWQKSFKKRGIAPEAPFSPETPPREATAPPTPPSEAPIATIPSKIEAQPPTKIEVATEAATPELSKVSVGEAGGEKYVESVRNMVSGESVGPDVGKIPLNAEEGQLFDRAKKWDRLGNKGKARELQAEVVRMVAKRVKREQAWDISVTSKPEATAVQGAALGSPEFWKSEGDRLGVKFVQMWDMGGGMAPVPMFEGGPGIENINLKPRESLEQGIARVKANAPAQKPETPMPIAEPGPVAVTEPPIPEPAGAPIPDRVAEIDQELVILDAKYKEKLANQDMRVPPPIRQEPLDQIVKRMDALDAEKAKLSTEIPPAPPPAEPPVQTPGEKFAKVRDIKSKQKKSEPAKVYDEYHKKEVSSLGTMISGFEPGKRITVNVDGDIGPGYGSTYPPWFKTVFPSDSAAAVATVVRRWEAGGKLSKRETRIMDSIHKMVKDSIDRGIDAATERPSAIPVSEGDIALGDTFRIDGEKFKAIKYDKGQLVIKDGVEHRFVPGDKIPIDGGEDGITRSTPEEVLKQAKESPKGQPFRLDTEEAPTAEAPLKPEVAGAQDELFPGERAKYRTPEKPPPAAPPEGGLFAKGEAGFAPEKDFRTKPSEPVDEGAPMSRSGIAKFLSEKFDIPLRVGRFRNALGIFKVGPEVIRTRFAHDIEVIAHEIGHALHKFLWPDARTGGGGLAAGPLRAFQDELIPIATKPRAGGSKNAEGFAEFIRRYVVNPDEAKRVAPKFFKFFEAELDAKSPDSKAILLKARADYKRWLEQPALARVMGSINQTPKAGAATTFRSLYRDSIDALFGFEEVTKEMAGVKRIDEVPTNKNPYKLAHLLAGWKGKADAWLEYKPYSFKTYRFSESVKSFRGILDPIKKSRDIFDAYLVSRRSVQLGETKTGILDADARKVIEDMERDHPEFKQAALELKHYQNGLLRYLYDGGIINGEQFLRMRSMNEDYVPFYRVMDYERAGGATGGGKGHEVKGSPIRHLKGSWRDIVSPTESIIKNTYAFINAAEKNAVGKSLVELSRTREGLGKFVEKIPADTQRIAVKDTELEDMLRKYGKWTETTQFQTTEQTIRESIRDETGAEIPAGERGTKLMKERAVEALKSRGYSEAEANTIVSRIASAKNETARSRIIERVTERATVRNTVREFGIEIPEGLAYIYRKSPNTPKGNVITVMERGKPVFYEVDERIYNAFHALDKESANTLIRILAVPARLLRAGATLTPEFALGKNPIRDQWTAFINSKYGYIPGVDLAKGLFTAVKKNEDYWRWKIGGGEHSAMVSMDREYFDKTWTEIMRDRGIKAEAIHVATHPIDVLRALSEFTEESTRLGEFKKGLKVEGKGELPGKTAIQNAAYASREVTLPFARVGAKTKSVNMIVAFWNANMQDLDKIHRQFKEYPLQTSIRTMAAITLPSVLLAIANHGNKKIDEIAQWQKDIFWLVDVGPFVMRIPKPFIMGIAFGSFPERVVNYILDKDSHAFDGLLESLSRGSLPGWMPTFANPVIENWANKSRFTDRAIVPKAREDVLPQYQYAPYTTETAKKIGGLLARIPGMKGSDLENLIVSPAKLENMIRGYTGGLGMWALRALNVSLGVVGAVPTRVEPTKKLADYPLISAFVVRYPTADSESIQRFFDGYKEAETNLKSAKLLVKRGEIGEAKEILTKDDVARLVMVKTALTNAHRIVELIYENPKILPDEKRRMIDQTYINMSVIAREGNKVLDKYKEAKKAAAK